VNGIASFNQNLALLGLFFPMLVRLTHYIDRNPEQFRGGDIISPELSARLQHWRAESQAFFPPWPWGGNTGTRDSGTTAEMGDGAAAAEGRNDDSAGERDAGKEDDGTGEKNDNGEGNSKNKQKKDNHEPDAN
jgi:hypothetical protein